MSQKPQPPKKPLNGYFRYQEEQMEIVKKANPKASHKELMSIIGQLYNKLSEDKKKPYTDRYEKERKEYQAQVEAYEKKHGKIQKKEKVSIKGKGNSQEAKEIKKQI